MFEPGLRAAKVGNQIRANGELHGDDTVSAFYIPLAFHISKAEANRIADDESWWSRHFNETAGKAPEPLDEKNFDITRRFKHKLQVARIRFVHSLANEECVFGPCKLAKIKFTGITGGMVEVTSELQTVPNLDADAAKFLGQLNHQLQIEFIGAELAAADRQQDMFPGGGSGASASSEEGSGDGDDEGSDDTAPSDDNPIHDIAAAVDAGKVFQDALETFPHSNDAAAHVENAGVEV